MATMAGATVRGDETDFRVWAPAVSRVTLRLMRRGEPDRDIDMERDPDGTFVATETAQPSDRYFYAVDGSHPVSDPVSRFLPDGVHSPTEIVDPAAFTWNDGNWRGRKLDDYILYELHVGTFTAEGTFDAIIPRLDYLKNGLGVTAIEIMPVAQFPGERNWGYDGVSPYAVQNSYGGPAGLKRLVDAAHACGLAVVLDVVYNHLGNEGNYLRLFGPYFTDRHSTPWGDAINYDQPGSEGVRRYFVDNALYWIREYHLDGLRLDAVQTIHDDSPKHILAEIAENVHRLGTELGRDLCVIAETDENDARIVRPREGSRPAALGRQPVGVPAVGAPDERARTLAEGTVGAPAFRPVNNSAFSSGLQPRNSAQPSSTADDVSHASSAPEGRHMIAQAVRPGTPGSRTQAPEGRNVIAQAVRPGKAGGGAEAPEGRQPFPDGYGLDAVWSDDFHHASHAFFTGERRGYYQDFGNAAQISKALNEGFVFQGEPFRYWNGRARGTPSAEMPPPAHVICIQNHDQIGNRALGERLTALVPRGVRFVASALLLLAPQTPLLFMGQEWDEPAPFLFFTSYGDPELKRAVSEGRRREFAEFDWKEVPDPEDPETFKHSHINWEYGLRGNSPMLRWCRELIALRKRLYGSEDNPGPAALKGHDFSRAGQAPSSCHAERASAREESAFGKGTASATPPSPESENVSCQGTAGRPGLLARDASEASTSAASAPTSPALAAGVRSCVAELLDGGAGIRVQIPRDEPQVLIVASLKPGAKFEACAGWREFMRQDEDGYRVAVYESQI